jgi:hypothetical protein
LVKTLVEARIVTRHQGTGRAGPGRNLGAFEAFDALFKASHLTSDENLADPLDLAGGIER